MSKSVSAEILAEYAEPLESEESYKGLRLNMEGWGIVESMAQECQLARKVLDVKVIEEGTIVEPVVRADLRTYKAFREEG